MTPGRACSRAARQARVRMPPRAAEAVELEGRLHDARLGEQRAAVDQPGGSDRRAQRRPERVRHGARGSVEADSPRAGRLLADDRGEGGGGIVDAEAVGADVRERARRAGERHVGVPDDQGRLLGLVLREHERLREDAADEGLEPAEPELRLRGEHQAGVEARLREEVAYARTALGELPGWRTMIHPR